MIKIALAGNPNAGKTTLFNALTGSNQFVGNWPGVTVEKKEGKLKKYDDVIITDLPGIYSLSPYTMEEIVSRNYLIDEKPDAILNIIDATNLERNLYLTTQLTEIGIPVVCALNMMDVVRKYGDKIDIAELSKQIGCPVIEISALKEENVFEAAEIAIRQAKTGRTLPQHSFSGSVEHAIAHIEEACVHDMNEEDQRWYAIKIFERDPKVLEKLNISEEVKSHIEKDIQAAETENDDDAESIIINERYNYIAKVLSPCYKKSKTARMDVSEKVDSILTNRWLGLPIFAAIMFGVYYIAMVTVGAFCTDWTNDCLFGDGWHMFGKGTAQYEEVSEAYTANSLIVEGFDAYVEENGSEPQGDFEYAITDEETLEVTKETATLEDYANAKAYLENNEEPDPADYGWWVPGIPVLVERALDAAQCAPWLKALILDGIVAGVGAVLGFVPQMFVLFALLAFLEACGYMARIAFILDRLFRKIGLSGKSFIPMLIGTGCGVPGIMASRTIENENNRRMTIMTTTFIPCSAKVPFIAMISGAIFGGSAWVSTGAYFIGMFAIIVSGLLLKNTKMFQGGAAPFVLELPAYHMPTAINILRSMWERGWSFIKKAGTIILVSTIFVWFTSNFGWSEGGFGMLSEEELELSILAKIGGCIAWIFAPLGWGNWQAAVASLTGLIAKENIVGTMSVLYSAGGNVWENLSHTFTPATGLSFLVFNLLCAPCFAAIGAIKREMNSKKWFWFAIGYQCGFAYIMAFIVNIIVSIITKNTASLGTIIVGLCLAAIVFLILFRMYKNKKSGKMSCSCGCSDCSGCAAGGSKE